MPIHVSMSIAAGIIGVCAKTLRRWEKSGFFRATFRTPGNHCRYNVSAVKSFKKQVSPSNSRSQDLMEAESETRVALYSRVSTTKQKQRGDLVRQENRLREYCTGKNYKVVNAFKDVGSGLNDSRAGLHRLIKLASLGRCDLVLVSYSDRLARFGTNILKTCFSAFGVDLRFLGRKDAVVSKEAELVNDITAILSSYMGKLYRMRRGDTKEASASV
jgi:putative resolvase